MGVGDQPTSWGRKAVSSQKGTGARWGGGGAALVLAPQGSPLLNPQRPRLYLCRPLCPLPGLRSALSPPCKICHLLLNVVYSVLAKNKFLFIFMESNSKFYESSPLWCFPLMLCMEGAPVLSQKSIYRHFLPGPEWFPPPTPHTTWIFNWQMSWGRSPAWSWTSLQPHTVPSDLKRPSSQGPSPSG